MRVSWVKPAPGYRSATTARRHPQPDRTNLLHRFVVAALLEWGHDPADPTPHLQSMSEQPIAPAFAQDADGKPRRVGVEIEFAGLDCAQSAEIVGAFTGGRIQMVDRYRYLVEETGQGTYVVELDTQYVHPSEQAEPERRAELESERLGHAIEQGLRIAIGEVTRLYLPIEVVCPPIPIADLAWLDGLTARLRRAGAQGSRESLVYAFGLQLNPDLPALDAETILTYLRAYLVSADWLRRDIGIDLTRRVLPFIQPYPRGYLRKVLPGGYAPELPQLIEDYLFHNPTRNRDLDLLPLFTFLAPEKVRAVVADPRLKARPALHYRLPDCNIQDPDWGVVTEWNRWARTVESLAADPARLQRMCDAYYAYLQDAWFPDWGADANAWLNR